MEVPIENGDRGLPPPPSPLTGCYLLIVLGEPHTEEHKDIILQRIAKGLLSWDASSCHVDLEKELTTITEQAPEGEEARHGERLIQFASENLVTEVLIHPASSTLIQCARNLLSSFTRHRHIIHAGYTFAGNGSWILQDGTFSLADLSEALQEVEVQRVMRAYENTISIDVHCSSEGDWSHLPKESFVRSCKLRLNPNDVLTSGSAPIAKFINYLSPFLYPADLSSLLESSDVVGNIRFSHPTLYVFPGGQGDAALFGINGFNMLLDGGFSRKACFWDFARHLDRLDAVLMTRLNNSNLNGLNAVLRRKKNNALYPQIGHFFCNIQDRRTILSPDGDKDKDPLIINLLEQGHEIVDNLRALNLRPQSCYRDSEPINLYHKVGHGTLDMYVLSPAKDSKEVRDFLQKWNNNDSKLFSNRKEGKDFSFPLQNLISVCALLVWKPANSNDTITRILFPGSTPQHKIFEGLDRLKHLEFMKHPVCTTKAISASASLVGLKSKQVKTNGAEKILTSEKSQKLSALESKQKSKAAVQKIAENGFKNGENENNANETKIVEPIKKSDSTESEKINGTSIDTKKTELNDKDNVEADIKKVDDKFDTKAKTRAVETKTTKTEHRSKIDTKQTSKVTTAGRTNRSSERKTKPALEKKTSPTTPKKTIQSDSAKDSGKPKTPIKHAVKPSPPNGTPAKSAKDANNRKVVESKYKPVQKRELSSKPPVDKKEVKTERKPISRRPKATTSPGRSAGSPAKIKPISLPAKTKLEKEATTDSSTVSTPSADQDTAVKKVDDAKLTSEEIEQRKAQELADLKEEQEVVKEIEAVFRKGEKHGGRVEGAAVTRAVMTTSIAEQTSEPQEEDEEYLIVEKEEIEQVIDQEQDSSNVKEESEIQKHLRDSEESEKVRIDDETDQPEEVIPNGIELIEADSCKVLEIISPEKKSEELPQADAKKEAKEKVEEISKDISIPSPEEKPDVSSEKKTTDTRDVDEEENKDLGDQNCALESQPDEKFSTTVESGATTAPTLPEDERIPLDEIKEDQVIEEKHVKEETKEKDVTEIVVTPEKVIEPPPKVPAITGIKFDTRASHIRDIVKTPDEVADLPVHEEADYQTYEGEFKQDDKKIDVQKPKDAVKDDIKFAATTVVADENLEQPVEEMTSKTIVIHEEGLAEIKAADVPQLPEVVTIDSKTGSPLKGTDLVAKILPIDKHELGSKSPKEREEDVALIVASVAEVLKSDAPLEEIGYVQFYPTKLRETHITTVESPVADFTSTFIHEEKPLVEEEKESVEVEKDAAALVDDTEKGLGIKSKSPELEKDTGSVRCMLVTASSEDGGEETVICPTGSITFVNGVETNSTSDFGPSNEDIIEEKAVEDSKDTEKKLDATLDDKVVVDCAKPPVTLITDEEGQLSGKTSPEQTVEGDGAVVSPTVLSGKATPDKVVEDKLESGKVSPDVQQVDIKSTKSDGSPKELSGKATPEIKETESAKDSPVNLSGKSTPDVKSTVVSPASTDVKEASRQSTPDVPIKTKDSPKVLSGKSSPDAKHDVDVLQKSFIASEIHTEISGKSTPDVTHATEDAVTVTSALGASKASSGKSTPDIKEKADLEKTASGKSTPDIKNEVVSGTISPELEKTMEVVVDSRRESKVSDILEAVKDSPKELSGKSTPDVKDVVLESKVETEKGSTKDVKENEKLEATQDAPNDLSGKTTPEIKESESAKLSPEVLSGKATPEIKELESAKLSPKELSGKATPDVLDDGKDIDTLEETKVSLNELSGKSSPDIKESVQDKEKVEPSMVITGKSTPEIVQAATDIEFAKGSPKDLSGKSTPDIKHEVKDTEKQEMSTVATSGKTTPDVQHEVKESAKISPKDLSGKSTPDIKHDVKETEILEISTVTSGKSSPEVIRDSKDTGSTKDSPKDLSGKSTPEIKHEIEKMENIETAKTISGKSTPEMLHDAKETEMAKVSSGKSTPDNKVIEKLEVNEKQAAQETSSEINKDLKEAVTDLSGKSTPDIKHDIIDSVKPDTSKVELSGKSTPDIKQDEKVLDSSEIAKNLSGKSTPDPKNDVKDVDTVGTAKDLSGKSSPVAHPDEKALERLSGKLSPDLNDDKKPLDSLEATKEVVLSGKSTPDVKQDEKIGDALETTKNLSGKSTPDAKIVDVIELPKGISGKSTPDIKQDETTMMSGKSTPDVKHDEKELSGKSTPDVKKEEKITDAIETPKDLSGKSTPDIKHDEKILDSVPTPKDSSGKSTPDIKHDEKRSDSIATPKDISGKSTPEVKHDEKISESIIASKDSSGKSTPDVKHDEKILDSIVTSKDVSGKSTPDIKHDEKILDSVPTPKDSSGKSTPDIKHDEKRSDSIATPKDISGKSTPEVKHDEKISESIIASKDSSGKSTPDVKHDEKILDSIVTSKGVSGKSTPDIKHDEKITDSITTTKDSSGRSTPDVKHDEKVSDEKAMTKDVSGKSTPDIKNDEKITDSIPTPKDSSGKSTPDVKHDEKRSDSIPTINDFSGKSTPDVKHDRKLSDAIETSKDISGKSTPDIKHDEKVIDSEPKPKDVSGKASPDVKHDDKITSSAATPKDLSGKSTPDVKHEIKLLESTEGSTELSGKSTPDIKQEVKVTEILDTPKSLSGKSTPDIVESKATETVQNVKDASGKTSPDIKHDVNGIESLDTSKDFSGKSTSSDAKEDTKDVPEKSVLNIEQEVKEEETVKDVLGKTTADIKHDTKEDNAILSSKSASGKSTPDIKVDGKETVSLDTPKTLSGKSTPDIHETKEIMTSTSEKSITEIVTELSGKSSPDVKHDTLETTRNLSGKSTPEIKQDLKDGLDCKKDLSRKSTPDIQHDDEKLSSELKDMSGKSTPDVKKIDVLETPKDLSGKSTPDGSHHIKDSEVITTLSGKSTPDVKEAHTGKSTPSKDVDVKEESGKSTPEIKDIDKLVMAKESPKDLSGKTTPEIKLATKESEKMDTPKDLSGKSTPEVHHEVNGFDVKDSSGKSTPDIKESFNGIKKIEATPDSILEAVNDAKSSEKHIDSPKQQSGKATPEIPHDAVIAEKRDSIVVPTTGSGKSTPEIKDLSGKSTPDPKTTDKQIDTPGKSTSDKFPAKEVDVLSTACELNGKTVAENGLNDWANEELVTTSLPDTKCDIKLSQTTLEQSRKSSTDVTESLPQDNKIDVLSAKVATSGKSTPDLAETAKHLSGKSTPDAGSKTVAVSGKSTPDTKQNESVDFNIDTKEDKVLSVKTCETSISLSGSSTPDKKHEKEATIDKKVAKEEQQQLVNGTSSEFEEELKYTEIKFQESQIAKEFIKTEHQFNTTVEEDISLMKIEEKHVLTTETGGFSEAGPSNFGKKDSPHSASTDPMDTSTDNLCLSGKSTPDIADVEHLKETSINVESPSKNIVTSLKISDVRSSTPGSDDFEQGGISSPPSDISSGQMSRAPHLWGPASSDEKQGYSDDEDVPDSPMSTTSQIAHSPPHHAIHKDAHMDLMSASFYGELPETDVSFQTALDEHLLTRGEDFMTRSVSPSYLHSITTAQFSSVLPCSETIATSSHTYEVTTQKSTAETTARQQQEASGGSQSKNHIYEITTAKYTTGMILEQSEDEDDDEDPIKSWGKPLGLPSPAPINDNKGTPKKERKVTSNMAIKNKMNDDKRRSESPSKQKANKRVVPFYVDLAYVPHHGNSNYSYVEFFKKIRARYYVFSGIEPSKEVYDALLEAKQTWEDKELEVTIIPTYDTDVLGYWVSENEDILAKYKIDLSPSASRCTINLQDHETSCSAYRLEF